MNRLRLFRALSFFAVFVAVLQINSNRSVVRASSITCDEIDEFFCCGALAEYLSWCEDECKGDLDNFDCNPFQEGYCSASADCRNVGSHGTPEPGCGNPPGN